MSDDNYIYEQLFKFYKKDLIKFNKNIYIFKSFIIGEGLHSKFLFGLNRNTRIPIVIRMDIISLFPCI